MSGIDMDDLTMNENIDNFSDEELDSIRKKTFNPELEDLIEKVTDTGQSRTFYEPDENLSDHGKLVKRINSLMYRASSALYAGRPIIIPDDPEIALSILEYELQLLGIDHYAIFTYSDKHECYTAQNSVFIDLHYIGMHKTELFESVKNGYYIDNNNIYFSLAGLLNNDSSKLFSNMLLPIFVCEIESPTNETVSQVLNQTSLIALLIKSIPSFRNQKDSMTFLNQVVHSELIRLQNNYQMIPDSVCYMIVTEYHDDENVNLFNYIMSEIKKVINGSSTVYQIRETISIVFLASDAVNPFHNRFLELREKNKSITLVNLENFRGRNFLSALYEKACGNKMCV
jgi:hypothetical protein